MQIFFPNKSLSPLLPPCIIYSVPVGGGGSLSLFFSPLFLFFFSGASSVCLQRKKDGWTTAKGKKGFVVELVGVWFSKSSAKDQTEEGFN